MWESRKKVELGRVGRKDRGHWVNGVGEEKKKKEDNALRRSIDENTISDDNYSV